MEHIQKTSRVERDSLRERDRQARAQMSSQASEPKEAVPMFRPPIRVNPAASDPVTQQIQKKLGDYAFMKQFLDDPKTSIGVYGEPASPAPGGHMRSVEFKKPHHTSSQNGRPSHRPLHSTKVSDGHHLSSTFHTRPAPPRLYNGKSPPSVGDPNGVPPIENILKEMASTIVQPLTAIAATPRKEMESKFNFNMNMNYQKINENISKTNIMPEPKPVPQPKQYLDSSTIPPELEKDLSLSDSDDESRKRKPAVARMTSGGGSTSGSESSSSDTDSDSTSDDDSKPHGARTPLESPSPEVDDQPEVVEGPGESAAPPHNRSSWSLASFVPPSDTTATAAASTFNVGRPSGSSPRSGGAGRASPPLRGGQRLSPGRSHPRASPRGSLKGSGNISSTAPGSNTSASSNTSNTTAESDSCYDSTSLVENVLAEAKGKTESFLSGLSDSDDGVYSEISRRTVSRPVVPGSGSDRGAVFRSSAGKTARKSPRTPVGPRPRSSPSASEDEAPSRPPRPDQERRRRGRPPKTAERGPPPEGPPREEDSVKRRRGRPPKAKPPVRPPSPASLSDEDRPDSSPAAPVQRWESSDDSEGECTTVATDKKKNDTLRKLFSAVGAGKGGGKGGAKGGKGKGQVMVIEAHSISEHEKEDDSVQRRLKEEEAQRKLREEEAQRRLREEEAQRKAEEEAAALQKAREEAERRKLKEMQRRQKDEEALRRKIKDEEALQKRREKEEAAIRRQKEEEAAAAQRRQREETAQRRLRENELAAQHRIKEEQGRKIKEEELRHLRFKEEEDALQKRLKEEEQPNLRRIKDEDPASRRSREEAASQRRSRTEECPSEAAGANCQVIVRVDLWRLSESCLGRLKRSRLLKRPPPPPPAPPDKKPKLARQNPETTPTNHERVENHPPRSGQPQIFYSYLENGHQDCSSDDESRDHKYYLTEAKRLRAAAESESDPLGRVMLYQESVLCFVLTGRVLELELDTKKAFTMYRETMEYIKSIQNMPARYRPSPQSALTKLDILSLRCQALLYLRMHKMYKGEVKEYHKTYQEYVQKPACPEAVGTVSPLSPTPSPAGSVGSVGSGGSSSGYGSGAPTLTPQHTPGGAAASSSSSSSAPASSTVSVPVAAHSALLYLTKYYSFLCVAHELWDQADSLIHSHQYTDLFVSVDRACGPLTLHSSFRHLVKYVRYAISLLKSQERHAT